MEGEADFLGDEVNAFEAVGKLIEEPAQDEEERFEGFDFFFEFDEFFEVGRGSDPGERADACGGEGIEEIYYFRTETGGELVVAEGAEFADGMQAPFGNDLEQLRREASGVERDRVEEIGNVLDVENRLGLAGGEESDIGIVGDADLGLELEGADAVDDAIGPMVRAIGEADGERVGGGIKFGKPAQIDRANTGSGGFEERRETGGALQQGFLRGFLLDGRAGAQSNFGATGHRLRGSHPGLDVAFARGDSHL